jgi:6,7-dimethyl-8-ribityllumazine synthase
MDDRFLVNNDSKTSMRAAHEHKIVIIAALANELVTGRLVQGATRACLSKGIQEQQITLVHVAGALEIPLALSKLANLGKFTVYVVLGAVIKGRTDHYDHVARMANDGVLSVGLKHSLALGNGILTVHSLEQALERADGPCGNLGFDAAMAAISLSNTFTHFENDVRTR